MTITINGTTGITSPGGDLSVSQGLSGNLNFTGTSNRITGDFSNATIASRVLLQSSTTNGQSALGLLPNGTSTQTQYIAFNSTDPANSSYIQALISATEARINSGQLGTGTNLPMTFYTGGSERVKIDTSGNVGIGTTSNLASSKLDVRGRIRTGTGNSSGDAEVVWSNYASATSAWNVSVRQDVGGANNDLKFLRFDSSGNYQGVAMQISSAAGNVGIGTASPGGKLEVVGGRTFLAAASELYACGVRYVSTGGAFYFGASDGTATPDGVFCQAGGSERMRITDGGSLLVGTQSSTFGQSGFLFLPSYSAAGNSGAAIQHINGSASGSNYLSFIYNAGQIGNIAQNGTTGVLYNLTSDYRLKNDPQPLTGSKDFIMALQPKKWQWWDGSGEGVGFIAHEFMEVAKYSGNGEKDAVDADGKPVYQSIQPSSSEVMANLIALVQELTARLEVLENK